MRITTKIIALGVTLCLLAVGGATALAASAGILPLTSSVTGTTVTNSPGPAPKVNGVPVSPTTGAGVLPSSTTPTDTGTTATNPPGPAPKVNGVPVNPTTGAGVLPSSGVQGKVVASYKGNDSAAIASGAALRHQVRLSCFKSAVRVQRKKVRIARACR